MSKVTIWHNPRCSKSRQTLALLEEEGITPEVRLYLEDAPSEGEIKDVLTKLQIDPRALIRTGEEAYREQALAQVTDPSELVKAMANTPKLIERPVVIKGDKAAIGRPPEQVREIL